MILLCMIFREQKKSWVQSQFLWWLKPELDTLPRHRSWRQLVLTWLMNQKVKTVLLKKKLVFIQGGNVLTWWIFVHRHYLFQEASSFELWETDKYNVEGQICEHIDYMYSWLKCSINANSPGLSRCLLYIDWISCSPVRVTFKLKKSQPSLLRFSDQPSAYCKFVLYGPVLNFISRNWKWWQLFNTLFVPDTCMFECLFQQCWPLLTSHTTLTSTSLQCPLFVVQET